MTDHSARKRDHLSVCLREDVAFRTTTTLLEEVDIVCRALPELHADHVDISAAFAGRELAAPLLIGAMTGGTETGPDWNRRLAAAAQRHRIGLCLGSMRPAIARPALLGEFAVRSAAPDVPILANIGAVQLRDLGTRTVLDTARSLEVDGIAVHLNTGMELVQSHGDRDFRGLLAAIADLVVAAGSSLTVMVKHTGMGLSYRDIDDLVGAGVTTVEVAGAGGTSWTAVEYHRANGIHKQVAAQLWDVGIPTAVSCLWAARRNVRCVASGGVTTGVDMAKCIALGADLCAIARPILAALHAGDEEVDDYIATLLATLRAFMVCAGATDLDALRRVPVVLGPRLRRLAAADPAWKETQ